MLLGALIVLGSPSFILLAAAANQCFAADDGGYDGFLYNAVRDYVEQDCANNKNCAVGQTYGWPMNSWCVGSVTDMSKLFYWISNTFNEDISGWDTSSVENMEWMFSFAKSFNGDLSAWNTSNVTKMDRMFYGATSFNGDLSAWDILSETDMTYMFRGATSFNQDLCAWGDKFPYDNAYGIFSYSGCTNKDDPQEDQKGPFCASDCSGYTHSPVITPEQLLVGEQNSPAATESPIVAETNADDTPAPIPESSGAVYYRGSIFTTAMSSLMILLGFYQ